MVRFAVLVGVIALVTMTVVGLAGMGKFRTAGFWAGLFVEAREAEHYESVVSMRDAADAVVLGRIVEVASGRVFGDPENDVVQYATATVEIERVLRGSVNEVAPGQLQLEVMVPDPSQLDEVVDATPDSRSVFFLRHKASELARLGAPDEVVAADQLFYRLVILRGVVWESEGLAAVHDSGESDFLLRLAGRPFADVVRESTP